MNPLGLLIRNLTCGMLGAVLIACGRVRRARKMALGPRVVTALYFHKPGAKLFLGCVRWLTKHGYTFISVGELIAFLDRRGSLPSGAVWLSFDDGSSELLENVLPVVRRYQIPVTLFIPSGIVGGDGKFPWVKETGGGRHAITVQDLRTISEYPEVTIGSHTVSHPDVRRCAEEELARELRDSMRMLEEWTGGAVDCLSYPYGLFDERATQAARSAGYALAVTTENRFVVPDTDPYLVPRFSIADAIWFPEMVCNIVGVWRPVLDPLKKLVQRVRSAPAVSSPASDQLPVETRF